MGLVLVMDVTLTASSSVRDAGSDTGETEAAGAGAAAGAVGLVERDTRRGLSLGRLPVSGSTLGGAPRAFVEGLCYRGKRGSDVKEGSNGQNMKKGGGRLEISGSQAGEQAGGEE